MSVPAKKSILHVMSVSVAKVSGKLREYIWIYSI